MRHARPFVVFSYEAMRPVAVVHELGYNSLYMQIKDPEIFTAVEGIGEHFRNNISNRFTRNGIFSMFLVPGTWNLIEDLTEKVENYRYQGYHFDEIYAQILAMARFVYQAKRELLPNIRSLATGGGDRVEASDKVLRDMAITNFGPNLKILADKVNELYVKVAAIDRENAGAKSPVFNQIPELKEIGRYLVE
jgi:hypothetical protein